MITIEPIAREHLSLVQKHASNPAIGATSTVPHPYPAQGAMRWYEHISLRIAAGHSKVFAIKCDGGFCGVMSLNNIKENTAELDYWVTYEFQGRGIATEAAGLAIRHARQSLNIVTLFSGCLLRNVASGRVLEKNGFKEINRTILEEGKFKGETFQRFQLRLREEDAAQPVAPAERPDKAPAIR